MVQHPVEGDGMPSALSSIDDWDTKFSHSIQLADEYTLYWRYDHDAQRVHFGVDVAANGWVGFGLSPNGGMIGSDVIIAWVGKTKNKIKYLRQSPAKYS